MTGETCYYCLKPAKTKVQAVTDGQIHYVCDEHARLMSRTEKGRNVGRDAGIG